GRLLAGDEGEQVAERAALVAERDVDVTEQRVTPLAGPDVAQGKWIFESAIGFFVRVAVDVAGVGVVAQLPAEPVAQRVTGRSAHRAPWSRSGGGCGGPSDRLRRTPHRGQP